MAEKLPDLLRKEDLCERYRINRTTLQRWVAAGKFPRPLRLGGGQPAWRADEIDEWERKQSATPARA